MGGYLSGRHRTRNRGTVESVCRIDLRFLRRKGALADGTLSSGSLRWTRQGEEVGSAGYEVNLASPDNGQLVVSFSFRGVARRTAIKLEAVPTRFGGHRLYARCPVSGRRCEVLPIVGGVVACRQVHRLTYASQSLDSLGRLRERAERCDLMLRRLRRRGRNRTLLAQKWTAAAMAFDNAFAAEWARRFGSEEKWL